MKVQIILDTIILYIILLKGARLDADSLSISQQKSVGSLVEMVVALGLLPNLVPGVGLQLHKRSDFLQSVLKVN